MTREEGNTPTEIMRRIVAKRCQGGAPLGLEAEALERLDADGRAGWRVRISIAPGGRGHLIDDDRAQAVGEG